MDNPEEILHSLEEFSKTKPKDIPRELDDYLCYVAKTGDPVFKWSLTKCLFREKLLKVITDFYESTLTIDLPPCPNVVQFHYENMKKSLLEKLDTFHGAPFTVQRISELLTNPRKEYNRADKFMRAIEKNILVVSTREPGKYSESDSENTQDTSINGIPEPADSPMETSFTCNDLAADPDSSSPSYEIVNSDSQDSTTYVKVDTDNLTQFSDSVKSDCAPSETVCEETSSADSDLLKSSNSTDETLKDVNVVDKESESVICSTVPVQSDSDCSESENSQETLEPSIRYQLSESKGEVEENSVETDSDKRSEEDISESITNEEVIEKNIEISEETSPRVDVQIEESGMSNPTEDETSSAKSISESELCVEQVLEPETVDSVEINSGTKEESPQDVKVIVSDETENKTLTVECDTSSSCDSDLESKQELPENGLLPDGDLGEGIVVTSCEYVCEDKEEVEGETCIREESVIHVTSSVEPESEPSQPEVEPEKEPELELELEPEIELEPEPKPEPEQEPEKESSQETETLSEPMEVDECQISSAGELEQ